MGAASMFASIGTESIGTLKGAQPKKLLPLRPAGTEESQRALLAIEIFYYQSDGVACSVCCRSRPHFGWINALQYILFHLHPYSYRVE